MRYLGDLGVKLDEAVVLAILTELEAPTMGELAREGFVDGWKTHQYNHCHFYTFIVCTGLTGGFVF